MKKFLIILLLVTGCAKEPAQQGLDWGGMKLPTNNPPNVYGSYAAGCMDGATALPAKGEGYEVVNGARNRFYGHPSLVAFLQKYAATNYQQNQQKLYISDISQPRGGPIVRGHGSHQVGLDVDIWYGKQGELPIDLVNVGRTSINQSKWQKFDTGMLKNAADFAEVERIFVDPYIKKELCALHKGEGWLSKIRPWRYHSDHFHVRIACPAGDKSCVAQASAASGDGCDATLDWWFSEEAALEAKKPKEFKPLILPGQCDGVFSSQNAISH